MAQVTEQKSIYSESVDSQIENLIPSEPVEVNIHETYTELDEITTLDIVGSGCMVGDDMHATYTISVLTLNSRTSDESIELFEREIVIPKYAEKRAQILGLETGNDVVLAGDYGTFTEYLWNGWWHILYPGSSKRSIDYDHADNYYIYYPEQWNLDWQQQHGSVGTVHYGKYQMDLALLTGSLVPVVSILAGLVGRLVAAILGTLLLILALLFVGISLFIVWIVQAEMGDGWAYAKVVGSARYISFGLWRDWWWRV